MVTWISFHILGEQQLNKLW